MLAYYRIDYFKLGITVKIPSAVFLISSQPKYVFDSSFTQPRVTTHLKNTKNNTKKGMNIQSFV